MVDIQDREPEIKEEIDRVGIEGLGTSLAFLLNGKKYRTDATISAFIDLDASKKGIHASRIIESITEFLEERKEATTLEDISKGILQDLHNKHSFKKGEIRIRGLLFLDRSSPRSRTVTKEPYAFVFSAFKSSEELRKELEVRVSGLTVCPHLLEKTGQRSHTQRTFLILNLNLGWGSELSLIDMIEICESCFSSPNYNLLKLPDEIDLLEKAFKNPKFVEDVVRECMKKVSDLGIKGKVNVKAYALESIHKYNLACEIQKVFD